MKKRISLFSLLLFCISGFSQSQDYFNTFRSAQELFNTGSYRAARTRFTIAQRKADRERYYEGKQTCYDMMDKCERCDEYIRNGDRSFSLGEYETARKYYDALAEVNPSDPGIIDRLAKCRKESDYLSAKQQADNFYLNKDWTQAHSLYSVCLDSAKKDLSGYKRFHDEVVQRDAVCIKQMNLFNTDSISKKVNEGIEKFRKKIKKDKNPKDSVSGKGYRPAPVQKFYCLNVLPDPGTPTERKLQPAVWVQTQRKRIS